MDKKEIEKILNQVSKKTGVSKENFKTVSNSKDISKILGKMDKDKAQKLKSVLDNPDETKKILASKKAQDILNKFFSS